MSEGEWLVSFDTDHIKEYLFATTKLKEILGASELLVKLNRSTEEQLGQTERIARQTCPALQTVYADGGGALFIVPEESDARRVIAAVEKLYRAETVIASITGSCLPLAPATREQGFGDRVRDLGFLLGRNKARKAVLPSQPVTPYFHLCSACGRHPAAEVSQGDLICRACAVKRRHAPPTTSHEPADFEELGRLAHPSGYLGFICADGNTMGEKLKLLGSIEDYQRFSAGLMRLLDEAEQASTRAYGQRDGKKPYIELLLGGDDLLLVTAADLALPIAHNLAQYFEVGSLQLLKDVGLQGKLTLSVGVVLAHVDYPIAELHRLAEKRLKTAKRCSFEAKDAAGQPYATGAIDFEVVTSAVDRPEERRPYRDRRPYILKDLEDFMAKACSLRGFPNSQLQAMYESLYCSEVNATLTNLLALARVRPRARQLALRDFFIWSGSLTSRWSPPWCGDDHQTALGDLVEIMPFIPQGGELCR